MAPWPCYQDFSRTRRQVRVAEIKTKNSTLTSYVCWRKLSKTVLYRNLRVLETDSNDPVLTGGLLVLIFVVFTWLNQLNSVKPPRMLGHIFSFSFRFLTLTCYRVFFLLSLSGILLITLLCNVLYVNSVIVCYLALFLPEFYVLSVTVFVAVDFFSRFP